MPFRTPGRGGGVGGRRVDVGARRGARARVGRQWGVSMDGHVPPSREGTIRHGGVCSQHPRDMRSRTRPSHATPSGWAPLLPHAGPVNCWQEVPPAKRHAVRDGHLPGPEGRSDTDGRGPSNPRLSFAAYSSWWRPKVATIEPFVHGSIRGGSKTDMIVPDDLIRSRFHDIDCMFAAMRTDFRRVGLGID